MILSNLTTLFLALQDTPAGDGEAAPESPSFLWPMLGIAAIFWFVMIAPERKRKKQRESMVEALKKGDKVMTTSGMYGTITQVQGDIVTLQVSDGVRIKFALAAIQGKVDAEGSKKDGGKDDKTLIPQKSGDKAPKGEATETVENSK